MEVASYELFPSFLLQAVLFQYRIHVFGLFVVTFSFSKVIGGWWREFVRFETYVLLIDWISVQLLPQKVCNLKIIAHFSIGETVYKINKYIIMYKIELCWLLTSIRADQIHGRMS